MTPTSWEHYSAEICKPAIVFELNDRYLSVSSASDDATEEGDNELGALRSGLRRLRVKMDHSMIRVVLSQGTLLATWQMFEFGIKNIACDVGISLKKNSGTQKRLSLPDLFANEFCRKFNISTLSCVGIKQEDWDKLDRIRLLRNEIAHNGGFFTSDSSKLSQEERAFILPLADYDMGAGKIYGPIVFPVSSLHAYARHLARCIELIGRYLEPSKC